MTQELFVFYADMRPHTNQEMYEHFANLYGDCDAHLQHTLRGLQQSLKQRGLIKNISRGTWAA